jgi:hypothetical protein
LPNKPNQKKPLIDWDLLEGVIEYPEFRPYILGVVERCGMPPVLCYDRSSVLDYLTEQMGDADTALEHFEFNVISGYLGPTTPVFLDTSIFGDDEDA